MAWKGSDYMDKKVYNIQKNIKIIALLSMCLLLFTACTKEPDKNQTTAETVGVTNENGESSSETSTNNLRDSTSDSNLVPPGTTAEGGLLQLLSEKSLEEYSDYEEIIIDPSGTSMVFTASETLQNVRLIGVSYNGDLFDEGLIYYDKETFTPEDAILITAVIPEGMPDLLLSYIDGSGNQKNYYISRSGTDGTLELLEESELLFSETTDSGND